jgi:hypothetical protein
MLLSYRNPEFWKEFQARHWRPRVPAVLRQPFRNFPFSEALLLRALQEFELGLRNGDHRKQCLVSVGDKETAPRRPLKKLFQQQSHSLQALERSCNQIFEKKNFGLMVTNMHAVDPGIWTAVAAFLQDARHCIDFPVPRAFMDLFYGRYSSSFTGLHKDTQEIFAFVVRGKKRMLAWPFEYFLPIVKGLNSGHRFFNKRLAIDHRKYRKDAVVLDAEAGDVIYWPSDYWHVSEARSRNFSAMLSLGILRTDFVLSEGSQSEFRQKLMNARAGADDLSGHSLLSQDMTDVMDSPDPAKQLRWVTGFGFEVGGPLAAPSRSVPKTGLRIVKNHSSLILWHIEKKKREITVASGGHSIVMPPSVESVALLKAIASGQVVSIADNAQREYDGSSRIVESYWNHRCEPRIRTLSSKRDQPVWLAHWLLRTGAVERK